MLFLRWPLNSSLFMPQLIHFILNDKISILSLVHLLALQDHLSELDLGIEALEYEVHKSSRDPRDSFTVSLVFDLIELKLSRQELIYCIINKQVYPE